MAKLALPFSETKLKEKKAIEEVQGLVLLDGQKNLGGWVFFFEFFFEFIFVSANFLQDRVKKHVCLIFFVLFCFVLFFSFMYFIFH